MSNKRPLILIDLDDTLFQTARKMPQGAERHTATLDVDGQPNGYMSAVQKSFVEWLLVSADVVPVTARSVEAYSRVQLPFTAGAVCSHGGVILQADGSLDRDWHGQMSEALAAYQTRLPALSAATLAIGEEMGFSLRGWVVEEQVLFAGSRASGHLAALHRRYWAVSLQELYKYPKTPSPRDHDVVDRVMPDA